MQEWDLTPEEITKIVRGWTWSFSRVNAFSQCLYAAYLKYVLGHDGLPNAWAQFGTACHETYEKYLKQEISMFEAADYYREAFSKYVTCDFPKNKYVDLGQKAFEQGEEYFNNINFDFDRYEVLGVEEELQFNIGDYKFHGFADAIYRNKETGEIILDDHKTSSFSYLKSGEVAKKDKEHFLSFKRQLYLYSIPLIEKYGRVDKLMWDMIRDNKQIIIPWQKEEFDEARLWALQNIVNLENETLWLPDNSSSFFCSCICDQRAECPYRPVGNV